jgi:hypothetical protein
VDSIGKFGGLLTCQRIKSLKWTNSFFVVLGIGVELYSLEQGMTFSMINLYGPYEERIPFRENLLGHQFMIIRNIIMGGVLNFTVKKVEIWAKLSREDPMVDFFTQKCEEVGLVNVEPMKCTPA